MFNINISYNSIKLRNRYTISLIHDRQFTNNISTLGSLHLENIESKEQLDKGDLQTLNVYSINLIGNLESTILSSDILMNDELLTNTNIYCDDKSIVVVYNTKIDPKFINSTISVNSLNNMNRCDDKVFDIINEQKKKVNKLLQNQYTFLTGSAGSGKTVLLKSLIRYGNKKTCVLATTGIASTHINGTTIHKGLNIRVSDYYDIGSYLPIEENNSYNYDLYIIDECSMLRSDLCEIILNRILQFNKNANIVFCGDIFQLRPIIENDDIKELLYENYNSEYCFDSKLFKALQFNCVHLKQVYRQSLSREVEILNKIRLGDVDDKLIDDLNDTLTIEKYSKVNHKDMLIITPYNRDADNINEDRLKATKGSEKRYGPITNIKTYSDWPENAPRFIKLKVKCKVMMTLNGSTYSNGDTGIVISLAKNVITVRLDRNGDKIKLTRVDWMQFGGLDQGFKEEPLEFYYLQFPIKLAYAITIHKSQGMTISNLFIKLGRKGLFEYSMLYVALSRCRSLKELIINRKITLEDVKVDAKLKSKWNDFLDS